MAKRINLLGETFGQLIVLDETIEVQGGSPVWVCKCSCGTVTKTTTRRLRSGKAKTCGCGRYKKLLTDSTKHGLCGTRLYNIYMSIQQRCNNITDKDYKDYGLRGIKICKEWQNVENFYNWSVENGYKDNLTIDRIDVNSGYSPSNCRWVDMQKQANNRRNNIFLNINEEKITLAECCKKYNLSYSKYQKRKCKGHNIEKEINELLNS